MIPLSGYYNLSPHWILFLVIVVVITIYCVIVYFTPCTHTSVKNKTENDNNI